MASMQEGVESKYDRRMELKAFDDSKLGVKGMVDAGLAKIPRIFIHPQHDLPLKSSFTDSQFSIPIIDLESVKNDDALHTEIIDRIRNACENWGIFHIVNHGISKSVLEEMIEGMRRFHEQENEVKREFYTRDFTKKVLLCSNFDLFQARAATWKDSFSCVVSPNPPEPRELPEVCRDIVVEFSKQLRILGYTLLELVSEALGLNPNHLKDMEFAEGIFFLGHYSPACPEPELTLGSRSHTDPNFLTAVLQDQVGGLQVLHDNQWIDVQPITGTLIINVGDVLQLVSRGRFKSVQHRVLANKKGPRISVVSFFNSSLQPSLRVKELLLDESPPNSNQLI